MHQGNLGEEVRRDDPVEYFLPTGVGSTSGVQEGVMAIHVLQNEEISGEGREKRFYYPSEKSEEGECTH